MAVAAFSAGVDMIMVVMDGDVESQTHAALVAYVEAQGLAGMERLDDSVARILDLKSKMGLLESNDLVDPPLDSNDEIRSLAESAALAGVTLFSPNVQSWNPIVDESVYLLEFGADPAFRFRRELGVDLSLASHLKDLIPDLTSTTLSHAPSQEQIEMALGVSHGAQIVIVALRDGWRYPIQIEAARRMALAAPRTIIVALWSPYDLSSLSDTGALLLATYGDNPVQLDALGEQLMSPELPRGISPVRIR
jgi:beta-glucosidase-like glycosyl hydrolase